jgi:hypothetical protein
MISDTETAIATPKIRRRLTIQDVEAIANLVATMKMTESQACLHLAIKPHQWIVWKNRAKRSALFETIIERTRANSIAGLVGKIQRAGDDQEIILPNGKIINKRGDWRAPAWLLEKTAPQFKPDNGQAPAPAITVQIGIIHEQLKRVIGFTDVKEIESSKLKMPIRNTRAL